MKDLFIFGSAELASLAAFYFEHDASRKPRGFVVDDAYISDQSFEGLPVLAWSDFLMRHAPTTAEVHVAVSYQGLNRLRESKFNQVAAAGYVLPSYVSSKSITWPGFAPGRNCFVLEGQNIQPRVVVRDNVMLWSNNHIGHGSVIEAHAYLASEVVISGHVTVGTRSFIGVNATVRDFVKIGDDCLVGMGAIVSRDLPSGCVVLAPQSTVLEGGDPKAQRILRASFGDSVLQVSPSTASLGKVVP